jgi:hypothetical protein
VRRPPSCIVAAAATTITIVLTAAAPAFGQVVTRSGGVHDAAGSPERVRRVLVVSLPNVEWADITDGTLPNLQHLFAKSSIGALITNGVTRPSPVGNSYATFGAGARAVANGTTAGQGFGVDELFGRDEAGQVFTTRTGRAPGRGIVYMPIDDVIDQNDSELYGAEVGLLGDELAGAGIGRAVIANGDGTDPSTPEDRVPPYRRAAVAALTTSAGRVPGGRVDRGILTQDPNAPFGLRLDPDAVMAAFRDAWSARRTVTLVEGSDLVRADLAGRFASDAQRDAMRASALRATDRLVGRLLAEVDPARDAVIVVGPVSPEARPALTTVAVRAPGFAPGLLRSTTTRHDGFVNMVDVAPTILELFGLDRPDAMEGRRMETGDTGGTLASRESFLVDSNEDGLFRDGQVGASMLVIIVVACVLAVATALVDQLRGRAASWRRRGAWVIAFLALALVGFLDASYLAGPFHFGRHGGAVAYWAFVGGVAVVLAAAFVAVARARLSRALLVALGSVIVLHLVDMVTGAHLEWNTVFGYSPTIGIRLVGEGNMTFAQLAAAATLFAGLLVWRVPERAGVRVAVGVLAVTIVVMGVPLWGNDFGAVLSALPGFALLAWLLLGHEIRARVIAAIIGIVVAAVIAVGLLDLLRPPDDRTHVGKFFQKVGTDFGGATLVIRRKASLNLAVLGHSLLMGTIIVVVLMVLFLWFVRPRTLRPTVAAIPTTEATVIAFLVVAVLGSALNDSGISIAGMMFAVFEVALVVLVGRAYLQAPAAEPADAPGDAPGDEPAMAAR